MFLLDSLNFVSLLYNRSNKVLHGSFTVLHVLIQSLLRLVGLHIHNIQHKQCIDKGQGDMVPKIKSGEAVP